MPLSEFRWNWNVIFETFDSKQLKWYSWLCYLGNVITEPLPSYMRYVIKT
jgi:hypothetical protein